jgi:pantoate--beta-alanine ligase
VLSEVSIPLQTVRTVAELRLVVDDWRRHGATVGMVPTMGALHDGHLALVRQAQRETDRVVVTLFVNPTQFAPTEDLSAYPRTEESDREKLAALGVDALFAPAPWRSIRPASPRRWSSAVRRRNWNRTSGRISSPGSLPSSPSSC